MFLSQELLTEGESEEEHSLQLPSSKCLQKDIFLVSESQSIQMVWILHLETVKIIYIVWTKTEFINKVII